LDAKRDSGKAKNENEKEKMNSLDLAGNEQAIFLGLRFKSYG
jgi:hypothetical protein